MRLIERDANALFRLTPQKQGYCLPILARRVRDRGGDCLRELDWGLLFGLFEGWMADNLNDKHYYEIQQCETLLELVSGLIAVHFRV